MIPVVLKARQRCPETALQPLPQTAEKPDPGREAVITGCRPLRRVGLDSYCRRPDGVVLNQGPMVGLAEQRGSGAGLVPR